MKRSLFGIVAVIILTIVTAWWAVPLMLQKHIEVYLDQSIPMENRQVCVVMGNPLNVCRGQIQRVTVEGNRVQTAGLVYEHVKINFTDLIFDWHKLLTNGMFIATRIGGGEVSASLDQQALERYLKTRVDAVENLQVDIQSDKISVSGELKLGDMSLGTITLEGVPLLKNNHLVLLPNGLRFNRWGINEVQSSLMKAIDIYDFRQFPIRVTAKEVKMTKGVIVVTAAPNQGI